MSTRKVFKKCDHSTDLFYGSLLLLIFLHWYYFA